MVTSELLTMDINGRSGRIAFLVSLLVALSAIAATAVLSHALDIQHLQLDKICVFGFGLWTTIIEIRRLHDIDWSGWWAASILTPLNFVLIIGLLIAPGTKGPNRFGIRLGADGV